MAGCPEGVHVAAVDFQGEQDVDPFQGDRAVDVKEVWVGMLEAARGNVAKSYRSPAAAREVSAAA
jgi:hypothetical protein